MWPKLWLVAASLLFVFALHAPASKVEAQSGRNKRAAPPAASPRQPANQRQRRASSSTSSTENSKTEAPSPINLPLNETPPPLPTPKPTQASAPASTSGTETQEGDQVDEADVVRINSNLVTVPASVVDNRGRAVIDLKLEDFELRVDGQPKEISELGHAETPVHMVMLFDNSMSLSAAREFEKQAAIKFFRSVMRPIDTAAIYSIWTVPILAQPFTSDVRTLVRTIEHFGKPEDGATALFDTVAQAADYLRANQGRKVIVIVSDGADTLSNMDFLASLKRVLTADVQVYAVQTGQLESVNLYNLAAHHRLLEYATQTGGAVYVPQLASDLDNAFAQISADLSQQYILSYYPQDDRNDGRFRTISLRVKTRPNMRVRARAGYYDKVGQKRAAQPVENINNAVSQQDSPRAEPSNNTSQAVINASLERSQLSVATNNASGTRTSAGGKSVGPPGPDDDVERPSRVGNARNNVPLEPPPSSTNPLESRPTPAPTPSPAPAPTPAATPTPTPTKTSTPATEPATKKPLSGGVLNGKALTLPKPVYPPAAKSIGATGTVTVEVLIDENGKVISARALSGPPMLQMAATQAARLAKFSPTRLSGQPVQVIGTITYSFVRPD